MKTLTILGSTGSIGTQTLDVISSHPGRFSVYALGAGANAELMSEQIASFAPSLAVMKDEETAARLKSILDDKYKEKAFDKPEILYGMEGYLKAVSADDVDIVVAAMVGMIGLRPVLKAIECGKDIALANKETLVCAGHIIMKAAMEHGVRLLPVDSEHSAIFQCLHDVPNGPFADGVPVNNAEDNPVETIFLTASGGPFRHADRETLKSVTVEQALNHPNWSMGKKITTDSATMINKGLEIIEARWLFGVGIDRIHVLVQPESIVHSMVGFRDGAVMAQLGTPDMRVPIQYALMYPERGLLDDERLDFEKAASIGFEKPRIDVLKGIPLAVESSRIGGSMPTVMNAANEYAVEKFLQKRVSFLEIYGMLEYAMEAHVVMEAPTLTEILEAEAWTIRTLDKWMVDHGKDYGG